jgi:hypothetical protein
LRGGNFDLSVSASGSPQLHFQWQAFNGSNWSIVGSDLPAYNTGALSQTTTYRVLFIQMQVVALAHILMKYH